MVDAVAALEVQEATDAVVKAERSCSGIGIGWVSCSVIRSL